MKTLNADLQTHLDNGTTTLCWCWRLSRADGVALGFTDHDQALSFDGSSFEPESGFAASEIRSGSDLAVDAQDAAGVLNSDWITDGTVTLTLLEAPVRALTAGDAFTLQAGCDKRMATCSAKFANAANFRGFPHIPGQDAVLRYASQGESNEGGML